MVDLNVTISTNALNENYLNISNKGQKLSD